MSRRRRRSRRRRSRTSGDEQKAEEEQEEDDEAQKRAVAAGAMWHQSQVSVNRGHIAQSDGVVSWLLQLLSLSVRRTASAQK